MGRYLRQHPSCGNRLVHENGWLNNDFQEVSAPVVMYWIIDNTGGERNGDFFIRTDITLPYPSGVGINISTYINSATYTNSGLSRGEDRVYYKGLPETIPSSTIAAPFVSSDGNVYETAEPKYEGWL